MNLLVIASFLSVVFLSGCANPTLTLHSSPPGATITEMETNKFIGIAPVTAFYQIGSLAKNRNSNGCYRVKGFEAKWPSGATGKTPSILELCGRGNNTFLVERDSSAPGLDADVANGNAVKAERQVEQNLQYQQQQLQNQAQPGLAAQAITAFGKAAVDARYHPPPPAPTPRPSGCEYRTFTVMTNGKTQFCSQDSFCNVSCF